MPPAWRGSLASHGEAVPCRTSCLQPLPDGGESSHGSEYADPLWDMFDNRPMHTQTPQTGGVMGRPAAWSKRWRR